MTDVKTHSRKNQTLLQAHNCGGSGKPQRPQRLLITPDQGVQAIKPITAEAE